MRPQLLISLVLALSAASCAAAEPKSKEPMGLLPRAVTTAEPEWIPYAVRAGRGVEADPRETHLAELRQLTFGGENAEAYFSPDSRHVIFQSTRDGAACDQMHVMSLANGETRRVSSGKGKTTCGFFFYPKGERVLYASTEAAGPGCPPRPDRSQGYVWPLDEHDIYAANVDGSGASILIGGKGYDAEATMAFDGSRIVFTSTRDGDLELYTARPDGGDVRRVTHAPGYDGGAFYSPDATKLVWRASRPEGAELTRYKAALARGVVEPRGLEIMVADAGGAHAHAVTKNGADNFAPAFLPDSRRVIFASDAYAGVSEGRMPNFDLFVVDPDAPVTVEGTPPLERVTFAAEFDSFPMFSPDGKHLVFTSNRHAARPGETNVFIARWVD